MKKSTKKTSPHRDAIFVLHRLLCVLNRLQDEKRIRWKSKTEGVKELQAAIETIKRAILDGTVEGHEVGAAPREHIKLVDLIMGSESYINLEPKKD